MRKILLTAMVGATLSACGSTTLSVPDRIDYNGQAAFDVVTVYTSGFDYPPTAEQTAVALTELRSGDGFSRLPARAAKACPSSGYRILHQEEAQVGSYLIQAQNRFVARWTQRFIIACN